MHTVLSSRSREVVIGPDQPFCIIGERINPTGRKAFAEALRAGDLSEIVKDVEDQVAGGAHVLDVNMGVPLTDEADLLARAIVLVQEHTDLPVCIDSSVVEALEAGLAVYEGKALVNSVTCEQDRLERVLPARQGARRRRHLPDERRDRDPADRRRAARDLQAPRRQRARPLRDPARGHGDRPARDDRRRRSRRPSSITLETIAGIRDEFGLNMTLGASNISFGLPARHALNAAFLAVASYAGLTSAIMDARTASDRGRVPRGRHPARPRRVGR